MMHFRQVVVALGLIVLASPVFAQSDSPASASSAASSASASSPVPDASSAPLPAQADAQPADWQGVIDHQIQAFRDHDADGALAEAAKAFHTMYPDSASFFSAIMTAGYEPIMNSQSDSFGEYQMVAPDTVLQRVNFVGKDQTLYDAIYQMGHEDAGWRVEAVQLTKAPGTGV